jgi:hypothetical protein
MACNVSSPLPPSPPPSSFFDSTALYIWFGVLLFFAKWCYTATFTAWQAVTVEIYPFKEERLVNEAWTVPWAWAGAIAAILSVQQVITNGSNEKDECLVEGEV